MRGRYGICHMPSVPLHAQLPPSTSSPRGTFVTTDDSTPTCHHHLKSIVHVRLTPAAARSVGSDRCVMTHIYHHGLIPSIFTALKVPYSTCSSLPPSHPWQPLIFYGLHSFASSRMSQSWNHEIGSLFIPKIFNPFLKEKNRCLLDNCSSFLARPYLALSVMLWISLADASRPEC